MLHYKNDIEHVGYATIDNVFTLEEVNAIISSINSVHRSNSSFRKTDDLFAIRRFLKEIPNVKPLIFNGKLKSLIENLFGDRYFVVKSIYFDKPKKSNWFVAWHQDLTISVDKRIDAPGYNSWTVKPNNFSVQPPENLLRDNFTIRIHLDDTDAQNGALKVISGSHRNVERFEDMKWDKADEKISCVSAGSIMIMRPLLMHSSDRTTSNKKRRVIHIEFSKSLLPAGLNWAEKDLIDN